MPLDPESLEEAIDLVIADGALWHSILHGPASGAGSTITTDNGPVPSVAKAIADLTAAIVVGNASGFVEKAADEAARLLVTPAQAFQLLIQQDTKAIYYAPTTVMGSWVIHPIMAAAEDAADAVAAVEALELIVAEQMATDDYVGGAATGVVRTAERIQALAAKLTAAPDATTHFHGTANDAIILRPALVPMPVTGLVDGVDNHSALANTSRLCTPAGTGFVLVGSPKRVVSWGAQVKAGILGSQCEGTVSHFPRFAHYAQQVDRVLPNFDKASLLTTVGQVVQIISQTASTMIRTADGLILVAGAITSGVKAIFGSGVDKTQKSFMPIFFDLTGANQIITQCDLREAIGNNTNATAIFVDDNEQIWLLTDNPQNAGYGNSLSGAQNTPVRLNPGYAGWAALVVQKVRCDASGGIYILFNNGDLWAGGGSNSTGLLGTGSTGNLLNPIQIASGVADFDVSGDVASSLALWILDTDGVLKAAGYNANGQMNQGNTTNKLSFVTVKEDVDLVRLGGSATVSVIYRDTDGVWYGNGLNTHGCFGQGASAATNHTAVTLTSLATLLSDNDDLVELCIAGYSALHATAVVCGNGKAFTAGNNTDGALSNGLLANANTWQEVLWAPLDKWEKIVDVSAGVGVSGGPSFVFLTNYGRALLAGTTTSGYATGVSPTAATTITQSLPIQLNHVL
jgi:alpha-tubulin suppressor-like RCC1 family protein